MSDTSGAYPPPPPPSVPPPVYGAPPAAQQTIQLPPGYKLPAGYQGPTAPDYAQPYQQQAAWQQQAYPQYPQPVNPGAVVFGSASTIFYQFGGSAIYPMIAGVLTVGVPLLFNRYYIILPIAGIVSGLRAMSRGRLLGGLVGTGLCVLGGIFTLFGLFGG